ncbi:AAA family ATPase [Staphylococcus pettenkoferi]|uniref:ATP-dependent nuclease n=1 Tax=Staphylococcus pettenkoferi TaxID=170573 RepID=UPI0030BD5F22
MYISQLDIVNFRNFKNSTLKFKKGVNTIIGENSSGKTNILYALRLLLDDNLPLNATKLLETDFNTSIQEDWKGHWIIIKVTFSELNNDIKDNFLTHYTQNIESEDNTGSFAYYFKPNDNVRKQMHKYSQQINQDVKDNSEVQGELKNYLKELTIEDYEVVYKERVQGDFTDPSQYREIVGDFDKLDFPNPEEDNKKILGIAMSHLSLMKQEISCTYIKALRNVIHDLKQRKRSPLLQLLKGSTSNLEVNQTKNIQRQIENINESISDLEEIKELTEKLKESLNNTLGLTYSPNVDIKSELPEEIEILFQSLTLWAGDDHSSKQGKMEDLSLGGANLIYITLKLLEYEFYQNKREKAAHFLLIEEPEAHIHTHVQKTLFDKYHFEDTQVIITTHSTHISSSSKISSMNILTKEKGYTEICHPSNGLDNYKIKRIERYLDATRSTLLFAKGVILVEGDSEMILIPEMFKKVFGISLDEIGISVINMSSAVFDNIAELFDDNRIKKRCAIITDLDIPLPKDSNTDNMDEGKSRAAQKSGETRINRLNEKYDSNSWVNVFCAKYTFEADYVINNNEKTVINTLEKIYKNQSDKERSASKLNGEAAEKMNEILRLAKKEGKGWFALLLAEEINEYTNIPNYILEAIAFVSKHITSEHLFVMAKYRIQKTVNDQYKDINENNLSEMLNYLCENRKDILNEFVNKVKE